MINPYDYLFYKLYRINSEIDPGNASFISAMLIVYFVFFNILSAFIFYYAENPDITVSKTQGVGLMAVLVIFNLLYFNRKRVERICNTYSKESKKYSLLGWILTISYVVLSVYLCFEVALPFLSEVLKARKS